MPSQQLSYLRNLTSKLHVKDKELHQRNQMLQLVMETVVSCAWVWDLASDAIEDSCGCGMERVFGEKITSFDAFKKVCHPDDLGRIEIALEAVLHQNKKFDECHRIITSEGQGKVLHTIAKMIDNNRVVGFSVEVTQDSDMSRRCKSGVLNE